MPIEVYFKNKVGPPSGGGGRAVRRRGRGAGGTWVTRPAISGGIAAGVGALLCGCRVRRSGRGAVSPCPPATPCGLAVRDRARRCGWACRARHWAGRHGEALDVAECPAAGGRFLEVSRTPGSRLRWPGAGRGRLVLLTERQFLDTLSAEKTLAGAVWGWDSQWFLFYFFSTCTF